MVNFADWLANPAAIRIVLVEVNVKSGGQEITRYLSTKPFVTSPTDTPPNQYYEPVLVSALQYAEVLDITGSGGMSGGDVEVANYAGERDRWLNDIWDNRSIKAWIGDPSWARTDFQMIFNGVVGTLRSSSRDTLTLTVFDKTQWLNTPITDQKISDIGGTGSNLGNVVSMTFGEVFNVTPQLVNAATLKYQVHNGPISGIGEVRDNGIPIANDHIGWAGVTVDNSKGTFTLNQSPAGTITCSLQGDASPTYAGTISSIIQRLVTNYGINTTRFTSADLDAANLASFDAACPQPVGLYATGGNSTLATYTDGLNTTYSATSGAPNSTSGGANLLSLCQSLAGSVDARIVMSRTGLLRLIQVAFPGSGTPVPIGPAQILEKTLVIHDRPLVKASVMIAFCQNYTVQNNLIGGITDAAKSIFSNPWLFTTATNLQTQADYKLNAAPPPEADTMLLKRTDANAEANRRVAMWSVPRTVFQFEGTPDLINSLQLGCAVVLTHPRFGLSAGKAGLVTSLSPNWFKGTITVQVLV